MKSCYVTKYFSDSEGSEEQIYIEIKHYATETHGYGVAYSTNKADAKIFESMAAAKRFIKFMNIYYGDTELVTELLA